MLIKKTRIRFLVLEGGLGVDCSLTPLPVGESFELESGTLPLRSSPTESTEHIFPQDAPVIETTL